MSGDDDGVQDSADNLSTDDGESQWEEDRMSGDDDDAQDSADDQSQWEEDRMSGDDVQDSPSEDDNGRDDASEDDARDDEHNSPRSEDDRLKSGDQHLGPAVSRRGFWDSSTVFLTKELSVHTVTCHKRGTYIVRSELLEKSGLSSQFSEPTLRRRCNRAIGGYQYAKKDLLRALKDRNLVSHNAKKVAVVTLEEAKKILTSFGHSTSTARMGVRVCKRDVTTHLDTEPLRRYLSDPIRLDRKSLKGALRCSTADNTVRTVSYFCRQVSPEDDCGIAVCTNASVLANFFEKYVSLYCIWFTPPYQY